MYSNNTQVAIIGCGYWGTNIVKTLISMNISKIYCYDKSYQNLKKIKNRFGRVTLCKDLDLLIKDKNIKIVFISVPTSLIYNYAKIFINNGKNVFLEKPVSKDENKISQLIELSKKNKVQIMSGYIYLYNDYIEYIKKKIKKKLLGNIKYVEFNRKNYGPIRDDVSALWDLASHDMSIVQYLFSGNIKKTKHLKTSITKKNIHDIYSINFNLNKISFNINVSWLYPEKVRQILIIGSKKILLFDELDIKSPIKIFEIIKKNLSTTNLPTIFFNPQKGIRIKKPFIPKFKKVSPLQKELKHCLRSFLNKKKPLTDASFALSIIRNLKKFI